jgi:hypothetical protein
MYCIFEMAYLFTVQSAATKTLEVHATELARNVHWTEVALGRDLACQPWEHGVDLVLHEVFPVDAVDVASLAVVVLWRTELMGFHFLVGPESLCAVWIRAFDL